MPDLPLPGPWGRLNFWAPGAKIDARDVCEPHGMGSGGRGHLGTPWGPGSCRFHGTLSAKSLLKFVQYYENYQNPCSFLLAFLIFSYNLGHPGSLALSPGPTGLMVNLALLVGGPGKGPKVKQ